MTRSYYEVCYKKKPKIKALKNNLYFNLKSKSLFLYFNIYHRQFCLKQ